MNHCLHDPRWVVEGACRCYVGAPQPLAYPDMLGECGHICTFAPAEVHRQTIVRGHRTGCFCKGEDRDPRCDPNAAPLPEVHQTPEPQKCSLCGHKIHGKNCDAPVLTIGRHNLTAEMPCSCDAVAFDPPPDQHVAPSRIWIVPTEDGFDSSWYDEKADRGKGYANQPTIEYRPIAPIQAALEKCPVVDKGFFVAVHKAEWDALIEAVKGKNINGK